ncbi:MAG: YbaB/EbfC family nucleoid-associated protein [Acholeplasmatales bacterium]|nr:YbaB/EbfC family nucleoid-associated protein [Acholeplasmatales bacterium]
MNPNMVKKIQRMQREMMEAQKQLEATEFTGTAAGVVEVTVLGSKEVLKVSINKDAIDSIDDLEMIEDTIVAALNNAFENVDNETQRVMSQFQMPGGFGF